VMPSFSSAGSDAAMKSFTTCYIGPLEAFLLSPNNPNNPNNPIAKVLF